MNDTPWPDAVHDGLGGPQHYPIIIAAPVHSDCVVGSCNHDQGCPSADQIVCAVCAIPDTGDFDTCDAIISAEWPCLASMREGT